MSSSHLTLSFLGGPYLPSPCQSYYQNLWSRCRSTPNLGSNKLLTIHLHLHFQIKNMRAEADKVGAREVCKQLLQFGFEGVLSCSIPSHFNLSYMWSSKLIFYYLVRSKHAWDSTSGIQEEFYIAFSHLIFTNAHQGITTPIFQMKNPRFRLACPGAAASKWLNVAFPTVACGSYSESQELDARILRLLC